jgi:hypothetical protein
MKSRNQPEESYRLAINCYKCSEGCVHLEYGNIFFTFTRQQFDVLAEVIGRVARELEEERFASVDETLLDDSKLPVM